MRPPKYVYTMQSVIRIRDVISRRRFVGRDRTSLATRRRRWSCGGKGAALETPWRESVDTRATCRGWRNMTAPGAISATWYCSSQPCGLYRCHRRRRRCRHSLFFCSTCCRRCRSVTAGRQAGGRRVLRDLVARRKGQAGLGGCRAPVFSRRR